MYAIKTSRIFKPNQARCNRLIIFVRVLFVVLVLGIDYFFHTL